MGNEKRPNTRKRSSLTDGTQDAIDFLKSDESSTKIRGNVMLSLHLDRIKLVAEEVGFEGRHLVELVDIAASSHWPEVVSRRLVKCFTPKMMVPAEAVLKAVSWLCTKIPSIQTQSLLLKWLVLVYDLIEEKEKLHALYSFIFSFINSDTLCPTACHLLYLMTRKEDVMPFRVRALLDLQKRIGAQSHILALLSIYKIYRPELVALTIPSTRKVFFRQTEAAWATIIQRVQNQKQEGLTDYNSNIPVSIIAGIEVHSVTDAAPVKKRQKVMELAPDVSVRIELGKSSQQQSILTDHKSTVPVTQIKTFKDFLQCADRIELPGQMASVLRNGFVQHLMCIEQDTAMVHRLSYWLHHTLHQEFFNNPKPVHIDARAKLLQDIVNFSNFIQEGIPVVENFLARYLHMWNGVDHRAQIFKLIARLRLCQYAGLQQLILEPLRKLFFCSSVYFKCQVLWCLTELLHNYVSVELPRHRETIKCQTQADDLATSYVESPACHSVFVEEIEKFNELETVRELMRFTSRLCAVGLRTERDHSLLMLYVQNYYHQACVVGEEHSLPVVVLPHITVCYHSLFSLQTLHLDRFSSLLVNYRIALEKVRQMPEESHRNESLRDITLFNRFILDYADTLWRYRAFTDRADSAYQGLAELTEESWGTVEKKQAFSIHHHPAMMAYVLRYLALTQPDGRKVHTSSIKPVRQHYLGFLERENIYGIPMFISSFVRTSNKK